MKIYKVTTRTVYTPESASEYVEYVSDRAIINPPGEYVVGSAETGTDEMWIETTDISNDSLSVVFGSNTCTVMTRITPITLRDSADGQPVHYGG